MKYKDLIFICNYERTLSINSIAKQLRNSGYSGRLICFLFDDYSRKIIENKIFDIVIDITDANSYKPSVFLENNSCIKMLKKDRYLDVNLENIELLKKIFSLLEVELSTIDTAILVGEVSWVYEELVMTYAENKGWEYLTPAAVRLLDRRWFLAPPMSESIMLPPQFNHGVQEFKEIFDFNKRPLYFNFSMKGLKFFNRFYGLSIKRLMFLIGSKKRRSLLMAKVAFFVSQVFEYFKSNKLSVSANKKIIIFPFQVQPESSVDYLAPEFKDQYETVFKIAKILPPECILAIKDHPAQFHEFHFFKKIKLIFSSKIIYLKTKLELKDFFKSINAGIVITGTIGMQLPLNGIPCVSLVPMFFNNHPLSMYAELEEVPKTLNFLQNISSKLNLDQANSNFYSHLEKNSMPGYSYQTEQFSFCDPLYIHSMVGELMERSKIIT